MLPVVPPAVTDLTVPPTTADNVDFDMRMDAFLVALPPFRLSVVALAANVFLNAGIAYSAAIAASEIAASSAGSAASAATSAADALAAKNAAVAAAQAAQVSAGLPALVNDSFLQVSSGGVLSWLAKTAETIWAKAVGGKVQGLGYTFVDKGTVAAGGTAAFLFSDGDTQRVQAAGALTITAGGWQPAGVRCEMELQCVKFGGKTVTWPAGLRWIIAGGGYTTTASSNGVTFQTAGTDYVLLWTDDGGATIYAKVLR